MRLDYVLDIRCYVMSKKGMSVPLRKGCHFFPVNIHANKAKVQSKSGAFCKLFSQPIDTKKSRFVSSDFSVTRDLQLLELLPFPVDTDMIMITFEAC